MRKSWTERGHVCRQCLNMGVARPLLICGFIANWSKLRPVAQFRETYAYYFTHAALEIARAIRQMSGLPTGNRPAAACQPNERPCNLRR